MSRESNAMETNVSNFSNNNNNNTTLTKQVEFKVPAPKIKRRQTSKQTDRGGCKLSKTENTPTPNRSKSAVKTKKRGSSIAKAKPKGVKTSHAIINGTTTTTTTNSKKGKKVEKLENLKHIEHFVEDCRKEFVSGCNARHHWGISDDIDHDTVNNIQWQRDALPYFVLPSSDCRKHAHQDTYEIQRHALYHKSLSAISPSSIQLSTHLGDHDKQNSNDDQILFFTDRNRQALPENYDHDVMDEEDSEKVVQFTKHIGFLPLRRHRHSDDVMYLKCAFCDLYLPVGITLLPPSSSSTQHYIERFFISTQSSNHYIACCNVCFAIDTDTINDFSIPLFQKAQ